MTTSDGESKQDEVTITSSELRELRRVYDFFCNLADKVKITDLLEPAEERLKLLNGPEMAEEDPETKEIEIMGLECDIEKYRALLDEIKDRDQQVVRPQDVAAMLKKLGKKTSKRDVLEMIWEADEKLDGVIDWDEMCLNFQRNIHDKTGLEPSSFYNLVQFEIYDANNNGRVSIDECMNMLYARYGREVMESKISVLFSTGGKAIKEEGKEGGEINFASYVEAVEKTQMQLFNASELGRTIADKKKRKVDPNRKK
ncbi:hypothetical protein TrRE_jg8285 [Triparma retinervis]|uniref:EF-hand domain-containing protein n=1 Tax=Triparma retinervis TaxID=2557542 RepID=A0A9W7EG87_9STRA|nr:hypothetical protein TrRE_jg8285 [Triparma retinervis]